MRRMTMLFAVVLALTSVGLSGQNPQQAYRAAVTLETVDGDLPGAIELYEKIAEGPDRALAATALLRMAGCYEKLGQAQARTIYTRIVKQYSDQRTQVVEAQARLAALAPAAPTNAAAEATGGRIVLPFPGGTVDLGGGGDYGISRDGRWGLIQDYSDNGINVGLFEYATRTVKWITDFSLYETRADSLVMSPDNSRVAYTAGGLLDGEDALEVHLATLNEAGDVIDRKVLLRKNPVGDHRSPIGIPSGTSGTGFWLHGWTPNDELIVRVPREDGWWQVSRLDIATKRLTQIASFPPNTVGGGAHLSPDGQFLALMHRQDEGIEIITQAVNGSKRSSITAITPPSFNRPAVGWSRDGSHLLFVGVGPAARPAPALRFRGSEQSDQRDLWAVRVEAGERVGAPFVVQRNYPTNEAPQWVGDKASYAVGSGQTGRVVTMHLDGTGVARRLAVAPDALEVTPRWSKGGDLAYLLLGNRRLVIQHPDGSTRERPVPDGITRLVGFNAEGTVVIADGPPPGNGNYPSDQPRSISLYDLETDRWSRVEIPGARPGWRAQPGFTAVHGGPADYVLYYPVARRDDAKQTNLGPFEIHRQDAAGRVTTVYSSNQPLDLGPRPFWLSADGSALRFVEGLYYRELDLQTGKARDLTQILDAGKAYTSESIRSVNPVSSADGRRVVIRPERGGNTLRIVDVLAGTSHEVTVLIDAIVGQQVDLTPEEQLAEVRLYPSLGEFQVSAAGDQIAATIRVFVSEYRILVEDPLEKHFRETGGR